MDSFCAFFAPEAGSQHRPGNQTIIPFFGMTCSVLFRQQASLLLMLHGLFQTFLVFNFD